VTWVDRSSNPEPCGERGPAEYSAMLKDSAAPKKKIPRCRIQLMAEDIFRVYCSG
jgi:hypothetical protein